MEKNKCGSAQSDAYRDLARAFRKAAGDADGISWRSTSGTGSLKVSYNVYKHSFTTY